MHYWVYVVYLVRLLLDHDYYYDDDDDYLMLTNVIVMNYQQQKDEIIGRNLVIVLHRTNHHDHRVRILVIAWIVHFVRNLEFVHRW